MHLEIRRGVVYGELAKCKRHVLCIAADLDEDGAILAESTSNLTLEATILDSLGQASSRRSANRSKRAAV